MTFGKYLYNNSKLFIIGFVGIQAFALVSNYIEPFSINEFWIIEGGSLFLLLLIVLIDYIEFRAKKNNGRI